METKTFLMTSSYYPPYHVGGDAMHVKYLSEELVKRGHEVHVMFSLDAYKYKMPEFKKSLKEIEKGNGVILHQLQSPLGSVDLYLTYIFGRSSYVENKFGELVKSIEPDTVHHHNIFFLGYDILKKRGNYINLYTAHDYWLICQRYDLMKYGRYECDKKNCISCTLLSKRFPQIWRYNGSLIRVMEYVDTIIAPSNYMKEKLEERLSSKVEIKHIPNFVPLPPKNIKDAKYKNYFLYVGVLERHKGICGLLSTFKDHCTDSKLVIVGKGSLKERIEKYIIKNELNDKIIVSGWVDDDTLWSLYKDALAVVIPSIWPENSPLVALEALSVGTPIIGTDKGGLGSIIEKIDKDLIANKDMLDNIEIVINNRSTSLTEKIKEIYSRIYSPENYLREYERLIYR